jgi:predicted metal-dependent enzyme (double-stranded beta helix superfamily)
VLDVREFVAECRSCLEQTEPRLAVSELLERTVDPTSQCAEALPATRAELTTLHHSPELTILNVVWAPGMSIWPHDHSMWAAIAIYTGQEDNTFFRRVDGSLEPRRTRELSTTDVVLLGDDVIHAVHNPLGECTGSIHVYGGDFFNRDVSQWEPDTLQKAGDVGPPWRVFEEANERLGL